MINFINEEFIKFLNLKVLQARIIKVVDINDRTISLALSKTLYRIKIVEIVG